MPHAADESKLTPNVYYMQTAGGLQLKPWAASAGRIVPGWRATYPFERQMTVLGTPSNLAGAFGIED